MAQKNVQQLLPSTGSAASAALAGSVDVNLT